MPWYCSICKDFFNDTNKISTTPCGHVFHSECLMRWIRESETCPECRQSVSSSSLVELHLNTENDFDFKARLKEKMEEMKKLGSQCRNAECKAIAYYQEKCEIELNFRNAELQKNQFIKSLETEIGGLKIINHYLKFENKHYKDVQTIVNGSQLEAEAVLSTYSTNLGEEDVAKKLASFCAILKSDLIRVTNQKTLELDRIIAEKKALELNLEQIRNVHSNEHSRITQLQKLVEKLKKDIFLLEKGKRDSSGYNYSKNTPSCDDEQDISMRDNTAGNDVDYSMIPVKFVKNQKPDP